MNYVTWAQAKIRFGTSKSIYGSGFMKYYSWLLTDTLLIVAVSAANPLILLARTQKYKISFGSSERNSEGRVPHSNRVIENRTSSMPANRGGSKRPNQSESFNNHITDNGITGGKEHESKKISDDL